MKLLTQLKTILDKELFPYYTNTDSLYEKINGIFMKTKEKSDRIQEIEKRTHIFGVEIKDNVLKITGIKDEEMVKFFGVYDTNQKRSHKGIGIKAIKSCVNFCIEQGIKFSFFPNDEGWGFWKKLSPIVQKKQNENTVNILFEGDELKQFQEDLINYYNLKNLS